MNTDPRVIPIVSGLLASGHYTENATDHSGLIEWDEGEDWQQDGSKRRLHSVVVSEAVELLEEIDEFYALKR